MSPDELRVEAALARLAELHPKLIDLGLDRGYRLLEKLGNPHHDLPPVIHLAGTNGKGSSLAFLRAIFEAAGQKTHGYTSPHLVRFHERIRVSGSLITDLELADLLEEVEAVNGDDPMTFFEITTAAAFLAFHRAEADVVLLETGLGGRADSTNVIAKPALTIITPIAKDHEHFLGTTLTEIAREKAGIMRKDVPCFSAAQSPEAEAALIAHADAIGAPLYIAGRDFTLTSGADGNDNAVEVSINGAQVTLSDLGLKGPHQHDNAGLITAALMATFPDLDHAAMMRGVKQAEWPGRVQALDHGVLADACPEGVSLWLDGAHNAHGASALAASLNQISTSPWVLICGALNTRPAKDFLDVLQPLLSQAITLTIPEQDAALPADEIAAAATELGIIASSAPDLSSAMSRAVAAAHAVQGNIIIAGSLYLAGHVLAENKTLPQ